MNQTNWLAPETDPEAEVVTAQRRRARPSTATHAWYKPCAGSVRPAARLDRRASRITCAVWLHRHPLALNEALAADRGEDQ